MKNKKRDMTGKNNPNYRHGPRYCECGKKLSSNTKGNKCGVCRYLVDYKNPFKGKSHSVETREKMKNNHAEISGNNNPFFGKKHTDKVKEGLSRVRKQIWANSSPEYKKKVTNALLRGLVTQRSGEYTNPEMMVAEELDKMETDFDHNKLLYNKFFVDFLLSDGTVIEVFGDYWHGNKNVFSSLTKTQEKQQAKDRARVAYLEKCGHRVIVIWEKELKDDRGVVFSRLFQDKKQEKE